MVKVWSVTLSLLVKAAVREISVRLSNIWEVLWKSHFEHKTYLYWIPVSSSKYYFDNDLERNALWDSLVTEARDVLLTYVNIEW